MVKNPPANMGLIPASEDPLEEERATPSSILAWEIAWTEEPGVYSPWGRKQSDTTERLNNRGVYQRRIEINCKSFQWSKPKQSE